MRLVRGLRLNSLFGLALSVPLLVGCGGGGASGPAEPTADMDELQQWLAENPDQDVDGLMETEGDFDE